jgi:hypothetical protein
MIETAFAEFTNGVTTVGTTITRLSSSPLRVHREIIIRASEGNTGTVFVGRSNQKAHPLTVSNGYPLNESNETVIVHCDDASNVYLIADDESQEVRWIAC